MAVRRTSTVMAEARAAARLRQAEQLQKQRERQEKIGKLAEDHAVALALAAEVDSRLADEIARLRARADEEIATHRLAADTAAVELLELGERAEAIADLLGLTAAEVRAARRRVRAGGDAAAVPVAVEGADASVAGEAAGVTAGSAAASVKSAGGEGASAAA